MFKLPKSQAILIASLCVLVLSHMGYVLVKNIAPTPSSTVKAELSYDPSETSTLCCDAVADSSVDCKEKHFQVSNVNELKAFFDKHNFCLKKAKAEGKIPHLYLAKLPKDMRKRKPSKTTFIKVVLPHVMKVNQDILIDRAKLLALQERLKRGGHLRQGEKRWLSQLASEYRCKSTRIESLLAHVDVIPPSLALAQGILESGWGTSAAAVNKNSTFGHMRTKKDVERFASLHHNVRAYIHNLNRHSAYTQFRQVRASLRKRNETISGHLLAAGLKKYSVRGEAYIRDIKALIQRHDLAGYDHIMPRQGLMHEL